MNLNYDLNMNQKAVATGSVKSMVYEDPEKFIDDFNNLIYGIIKNPHSGVFIYRGGLGSDKLIPSIDRPNDKEKILSFGGKFGWQTSPILHAYTKASCLLGAIGSFYRRAINLGYELPQIDRKLHDELMNPSYVKSSYWPTQDLFQDPRNWQLIAMAQHHGVPTPLLDWTSDAYIAMYFAATRGVKQLVKTESFDALADQQIVVWATFQEFFHYSVIDPLTSQSTSADPTPVPLADFYPYRIHLVDPPRHYNPNLTAQRGKFTLVQKMTQGKDTSEFNHDDVFGLPDLETVWSEMVKAPQVVAAHWHSAVLYKFSLPVKKATTLLKILKIKGFDAAGIFPGLDGCVKAIEEGIQIQKAEKLLGASAA